MKTHKNKNYKNNYNNKNRSDTVKYPTNTQDISPINEDIELNKTDSDPIVEVSNNKIRTQTPRPRNTSTSRGANTKASSRFQSRNFSSSKTPTFNFEMNMEKTSLLTIPEITSSILPADKTLIEDGKLDGSIYNEIQKFSTVNRANEYIPKIAFIRSKSMKFFGIALDRLINSIPAPNDVYEQTYAKPYNDVVSVLTASQYTNLPIFSLSAGPNASTPAQILAYIDQCDTYASLLTNKAVYILKMIKALSKELITQYSEQAPLLLQVNAVLHKAAIRTALAAVIQSASKLSCNEKLIKTYFETQSSMTYIEEQNSITGMYFATEYDLVTKIWDFYGSGKSLNFLKINLQFGDTTDPVISQDFASVYHVNKVPNKIPLIGKDCDSVWDSEYWIELLYATVFKTNEMTPIKFANHMEQFLQNVSSIASTYSSEMQEFNSAKVRLQEVGVYNRSRLIIDAETDYNIARTSQGASLLALPPGVQPQVGENDNFVTFDCPVYANGINPINLSSTLLFFTPYVDVNKGIVQYLYDLIDSNVNITTYGNHRFVLQSVVGSNSRRVVYKFNREGFDPIRLPFSLLSRFIPNLVIENLTGIVDRSLTSLDVPILATQAAVPIITSQIVNTISALSITGGN